MEITTAEEWYAYVRLNIYELYIERSEDDWLHCFVRNGKFEGPCGPFNLPEILQIFRTWVES